MKLSAVVVHYHTPELAARTVDSLWRQALPPGADLEVLLVDNGSDAAGRERLAALRCRLLEPGDNLGYAAAVDLGVSQAAGDVLVLANSDLELLPGALARLAATLAERTDRGGAAIVGPRFVWDPAGRFVMPPAERRDRVSELMSRLAARGAGWAALARRRWRRHARRHWRAQEPLPSPHLSGALLVVSRAAWQRVGELDPGFRLYFEETDWLRRATALGVPIVYEPRARVVHRYGRSAVLEPRAAAWFAVSADRFSRRWYGPSFRALRRLATPAHDRLSFPPLQPERGRPRLDLHALPGAAAAAAGAGRLWLELSPLARGYPAAAERLPPGRRHWELPEELWRGMDAGTWRLALVDEAGRERFRAGLRVPPPEERR